MWPVAAVLDRTGLEHVKERAVSKGFHGVGSRLSMVPFLLGFLRGSESRGWRGGMLSMPRSGQWFGSICSDQSSKRNFPFGTEFPLRGLR